MQNPVDSPGSIFKTSPYQAQTELDVKDTLFDIYEGLSVLDFNEIKSTGNKSFYLSLIYNESYK